MLGSWKINPCLKVYSRVSFYTFLLSHPLSSYPPPQLLLHYPPSSYMLFSSFLPSYRSTTSSPSSSTSSFYYPTIITSSTSFYLHSTTYSSTSSSQTRPHFANPSASCSSTTSTSPLLNVPYHLLYYQLRLLMITFVLLIFILVFPFPSYRLLPANAIPPLPHYCDRIIKHLLLSYLHYTLI